LRKKTKHNIILSSVAAIVIIIVIGYFYSVDQAKVRGFTFGNELQQIQDDLKELQTGFDSQVKLWKDGNITKDEVLEYSEDHIVQMENLYQRYEKLSVPAPFISSVELFKLSTEIQIQSDKEFILWIDTGDESHRIRSDKLLQESFEYEVAALGKFNSAKKG
jgi:hypothetical protein